MLTALAILRQRDPLCGLHYTELCYDSLLHFCKILLPFFRSLVDHFIQWLIFSFSGELSRHEMPLPPSVGCASTAFLTHAPFTAFDAGQRSRVSMLDDLDSGLARPRTCMDSRENTRWVDQIFESFAQ